MLWTELILAYMAFLLAHMIPARRNIRQRLAQYLGEKGYLFLYSLFSVILLGWIFVAAKRAPYLPLWDLDIWQRHVALLGMPLVCVLVVFGVTSPNPLSFGAWRNDRFDPSALGIVGVIRHPLLGALALWAFLHMMTNGDVAHLFVFGSFMLFSCLGAYRIDKRKKNIFGLKTWKALAYGTPSQTPWQKVKGLLHPKQLWRFALGFLLYAALLWGHSLVFGVSPIG